MKKYTFYYFLFCLMALVACNEEGMENTLPVTNTVQKMDAKLFNTEAAIPGQLVVKLKNELTAAPVVTRTNGVTEVATGNESLDAYVRSIGAKNMVRVFPHAGKFETRTRGAGLHLWYVIEFDETKALTRAARDLADSEEIILVEPAYEVKRTGSDKFRCFDPKDIQEINPAASGNGFNDPLLRAQWHYHNDGSIIKSIAGADIRLFGAWEKSTGNREVIVSVVDGGIDYTHVDLAANMWINETEMSGQDGVDDDGNGYKDDIYGFNFVNGKGIEAHMHGTHVGGTIAAVNNNGVGVSGIAGGDGTPGSGVRLMSCQIFIENENEKRGAASYYTGAAIKYGADNGAVISQNSWGYDAGTSSGTPVHILEAIKYFVENAGIDENGNQVGPMKGGIVFFAAGNDNSSLDTYPSSEDDVISVAAMGPDYKRASYSNYGITVDLIAPGGEMGYDPARASTSVLSTAAGWNGLEVVKNGYYYMDGTSMACPHVSGIAALVVSKFGVGKSGFTPEKLKMILFASAYDVYSYNPNYQDFLGYGVPDASRALEGLKVFDPNINKGEGVWNDIGDGEIR